MGLRHGILIALGARLTLGEQDALTRLVAIGDRRGKIANLAFTGRRNRCRDRDGSPTFHAGGSAYGS